jgi:hypothetical protein
LIFGRALKIKVSAAKPKLATPETVAYPAAEINFIAIYSCINVNCVDDESLLD